MNMQVVDILFAIRTGIDDDTETTLRISRFGTSHFDAVFFCQLRNERHHFTQ